MFYTSDITQQHFFASKEALKVMFETHFTDLTDVTLACKDTDDDNDCEDHEEFWKDILGDMSVFIDSLVFHL